MQNDISKKDVRVADIKIDVFPSNLRSQEAVARVKAASLVEGKANEGDLVVAEMLSEKGAITAIERSDVSLHDLKKGERFIGTVCHRDSGVSLVGHVPEGGLAIPGEADILANAGGVGICTSYPSYSRNAAAKVQPIPAARVRLLGILNENGKNMNLLQLNSKAKADLISPVVMVVGTSSECGKTTVTRRIIEHLSKFHRVGAAKISGTGRLRDIAHLKDGGAIRAVDFVDMGLPSTYGDSNRAGNVAVDVIRAASLDTDVVVAEAGGDIIWAGIPEALIKPEFRQNVALVVLSANDALGAFGAMHFLKEWGYTTPIVCGPVCNLESGIERLHKKVGLHGIDVHSNHGLAQLHGFVDEALTAYAAKRPLKAAIRTNKLECPSGTGGE